MPNVKPSDFKNRTRRFALEVIRLCGRLPRTIEHRVIAQQLIRSASSVGANYRSACRAQSRASFIAKLAIVEEEADESIYWLELIETVPSDIQTEIARLSQEAGELVAMTVASRKTARKNGALIRQSTIDNRQLP